jgi:hypothetical protein
VAKYFFRNNSNVTPSLFPLSPIYSHIDNIIKGAGRMSTILDIRTLEAVDSYQVVAAIDPEEDQEAVVAY